MKNEITTANKELIQRFYKEVLVDWNMSLVDEVVLPEFISHDWPKGGPIGPQGFRDFYSSIRSALSDARYEIDDLFAEYDRVVVRWRLLGTHKGEYLGIAATGRAVTLKGMAIYRLDGGKLKERWVVTDMHGLLREMKESTTLEGQ